jgi:hypothetical protein
MEITQEQKDKLWKLLSSVTYCSISTCSDGQPHSTMVQPAITPDWKIIILSGFSKKKVMNLKLNNKTWLTFDLTGMMKIPKVVYIQGTAQVDQVNQEIFDEFLSYHGLMTKKILTKLQSDDFSDSARITVIPEKAITIGVFGKSQEPISFNINK